MSELQKQCDNFNARTPVGSMVRVWTAVRGEGPGKVGLVRYRAYVLSGHTPVVFVEGIRGCVALSHVVPETPTVGSGGEE